MRITPRASVGLVIAQTGLVHAITYLARPYITYAALDAGINTGMLGIIGAAYAAVALAIAIPMGKRNDRHGPWPLFVLGSGLMGLAAVILWSRPSTGLALAGVAGILGAGHLACTVAAQSAIAEAAPPGRLDAFFGHLTLVASLGQALGPLALGLQTDTAQDGDLAEPATVLTALALLLIVLTLTNRLGRAPRRSGEVTPSRVRDILTIKGLPSAVLASAVILSAVDLTIIYLPVIGVERQLGAGAVGALLALRGVASMASRFGIGSIVARIGRTRFMVVSVALSGVTLIATAIPMPLALLGFVIILMGLGLGVGQPLTLAWLSSVAPPRERGLALALRLTGNRIGQLAIPAGVGLVAPVFGAGAVFVVAGLAVGSLAFLFRPGALESGRT